MSPCALEERDLAFLRVLFIAINVNNTKRTVIAGLLVLSLCLPVRAERRDTLVVSGHAIEEVEIQSQRLSREVSATAPTQVMRHEMMHALAIQNAADAMRHFAGTIVKDYGGIGGLKTVSVRGLGATHTAVSYDGVVIGNCQSGQIDLGRFSSNGLSSISLHVGQDDDMTGTARALASGSMVNMKSIAPQWNRKPYHAEANITIGSFGLYNPSVTYSQKLGEQTWTTISADFSAAHGHYPYILTNGIKKTNEQRTNTDITQQAYEWNLQHTSDNNSNIRIKAYHYNSERGLPGAVILYNNCSTERLAERNTFVQTQYTKYWGHQWQLRTIAKYTSGWSRYTDTNVKYADGKQIDENSQHEYYAATTILYHPSTTWSISLAQDGHVNTLTSNIPLCPSPIRYTSLTALQAQYRNEWFRIRGILLGTAIKEETSASEQPTIQNEKLPDDTKNIQLTTKLSPTLSVSIRPLSHIPIFIRAMYKETFRMPTFNDLYYFRSGNKNLRPEHAKEYNAGITWQAPKTRFLKELTLTADAYFNDVTDKIVAFPTTYVWKMANYGHVHIIGLDASLSAQCLITPKTALSIGASYTLQHATDITDPEAQNYRMQLPYTPLHSGSGRLLLITPWANVGYSIIASSLRYSMSEQTARYLLPPYAEQAITISQNFSLNSVNLTAQIEAINFTNSQYEIIQYYPMPGRQFRASLIIKL